VNAQLNMARLFENISHDRHLSSVNKYEMTL